MRMMGFFLRKGLGLKLDTPQPNLDQHQELEISNYEAIVGGEKAFILKQGKKSKKLMVKIPAGIQPGTQIRLKGLGAKKGKQTGDLYLRVKLTQGNHDIDGSDQGESTR